MTPPSPPPRRPLAMQIASSVLQIMSAGLLPRGWRSPDRVPLSQIHPSVPQEPPSGAPARRPDLGSATFEGRAPMKRLWLGLLIGAAACGNSTGPSFPTLAGTY